MEFEKKESKMMTAFSLNNGLFMSEVGRPVVEQQRKLVGKRELNSHRV